MGCVSSTLLTHDDEFPKIGGFSHHFVSLTSTTYGLLNTLDPPPADPLPPETINAWDLMSDLDENADPNLPNPPLNLNNFLEKFEKICPPRGEKRVVLYTTSLRGVRKTFEDCEAVRSSIMGLGIPVCERDISMHRGFRDELRELVKGKTADHCIPPRLFVEGRYVGGAEEVIGIVDKGSIAALVQGLPKLGGVCVCEGCGGAGFFPCSTCHGSCKMVKEGCGIGVRSVVVKCGDCNENGLVLCPVCS
ncbi:hypothetical protein SASPL_109576 [Salvia splendens]|uniref:Glutaredoxin domain-containing protein n=1 Tax=Salvia splendens TaxID=180675 RepID=A0A8X8YIW6_SALSN|nr:uncharacterized protein At5g39865-like [Salvia splendens]KAG6431497.1 hypothetical protein SASPL_109576 [Salvia splendens]